MSCYTEKNLQHNRAHQSVEAIKRYWGSLIIRPSAAKLYNSSSNARTSARSTGTSLLTIPQTIFEDTLAYPRMRRLRKAMMRRMVSRIYIEGNLGHFYSCFEIRIVDRIGFDEIYRRLKKLFEPLHQEKILLRVFHRRHRLEANPEYPMGALREAITNAVMHRDWFIEGANVFVEIYADRIEIVSPGGLPAGLSAEELGSRSVRRNPLVADLLHRIGFIEKAGTGIGRMRQEAREHGCPAPEFRADGFFTTVFRPLLATQQVGTKLALSRHQVLILRKCLDEQPLRELLAVAGRSDRTKFRKQVLGPLIEAGLVEMTSPDKPRSSIQRYRITEQGREALSQESGRS